MLLTTVKYIIVSQCSSNATGSKHYQSIGQILDVLLYRFLKLSIITLLPISLQKFTVLGKIEENNSWLLLLA